MMCPFMVYINTEAILKKKCWCNFRQLFAALILTMIRKKKTQWKKHMSIKKCRDATMIVHTVCLYMCSEEKCWLPYGWEDLKVWNIL